METFKAGRLSAINEKNEALWPTKYPIDYLERTKRNQPSRWWNALYMQEPFAGEGNIFKRDYWQKWPSTKPVPTCSFIIQSWDTAVTDQDIASASYSARTTWGLFQRDDEKAPNLFLLEAWRGRVDWNNLTKEALRAYKEYEPDKVLIEKKSSGQSLLQMLRRLGVPVSAFASNEGKVQRANVAQPLWENGRVYYPDRKWAEEVIEEAAAFPQGQHNDYVDTMSMTGIWLQRSWMMVPIGMGDDDDDEESNVVSIHRKRKAAYG